MTGSCHSCLQEEGVHFLVSLLPSLITACSAGKSRAYRHLAGCGLRLRLARSRLAAPHGAPLAPTAAAQALDTATFIFLNALGKKAKAKTAERRARVRGERGARAGSQERGPQASGLRTAVPAAFRLEPRPPETPISQPMALVAAAQRALARLRGPRRLGPLALLASSAFRFSTRRGLAAAGGPET